jgi:prepilin signal peptidase PulO-like enzyme (type II secretory pathway)
MYIWLGRSQCIHCGEKLSWYEIVPVLSYIFLRGKCRRCHRVIPWYYPLVELGMALVVTQLFFLHQKADFIVSGLFFRDLFFITLLTVLCIYDALYKEILSMAVLIGIIAGVVCNWLFLSPELSPQSMLIGMVFGGGIFLLQFLVSRGVWIGSGDIYLGTMMGVWLGWPRILIALFFAYIFGGAYSLGLLFVHKFRRGMEVPFAPFLTLGTLIAFYYGKVLLEWYIQFIA